MSEPTNALDACANEQLTQDDCLKAVRIAHILGETAFAYRLLAIVEGIQEEAAAMLYAKSISNPGLYSTH